MKKISISLFLGFLLMVLASHDCYAEIRGPISDIESSFQEEGMPMASPMRHRGMEMIEVMPGGQHAIWKYLMDLGLGDKQKAEVKEIKSRVMKEMIKKRADEHIAHIELRDLLDKDPVDMKAIEAKLKQMERVKTEMYLSLIKAREEVKSKLTPEQRKKFKETLEIDPIMGGMMHGGVRMPPPPCEKKEDMQPPREHMLH